MKHLLAFFVLGALLFVGRRELAGLHEERPRLVVAVPHKASAAEVERAIDQALLTNLALATDAVRVDPIVREQLLRAMRGARDEHAEEDELVTRALALGLHRVDPVVRDRLAFQGEQLLRAGLRPEQPGEAELARYLAAHEARYHEPARLSFRQVFLGRSRRGERLAQDAERVRAQLVATAPVLRDERALSDPTILPLALAEADERELDARFGPGFGRALFALPVDVWSAPIASAYGLHLVRVTARLPAHLPSLAQLRARVLSDYQHDRLRTRVSRELVALRERYRVDVQRSGS